MASNETKLTGSETMDVTAATTASWSDDYKKLAGDRMLVIGMIAIALGIEDLESAYSDPAVILQAIEELKGTSNDHNHRD